MSPEVDGVARFLLGYFLILAMPGPNMVALGCIAALRGVRAALPMAAGITCGTASLGLVVLLLLCGLVQVDLAAPGMRGMAALLLLCVAFSILRVPIPIVAPAEIRPQPSERGQAVTAWLAGFWTAVSNPVTAAYLAAGLLPLIRGPGDAGPQAVVATAGIPVLAFGWWVMLAVLMARPAVRRFVDAWQRPIRASAALAIAAMALPILWPLLRQPVALDSLVSLP